MSTHAVAVLVALTLVLFMIELLRRRQVKEKYAALWLAVGAGMLFLGVFPGVLDRVADAFGVADPPNLLLFGAVVLLLVVDVHLSWEVSRLEEETRTLAESHALLQERLERLEAQDLDR